MLECIIGISCTTPVYRTSVLQFQLMSVISSKEIIIGESARCWPPLRVQSFRLQKLNYSCDWHPGIPSLSLIPSSLMNWRTQITTQPHTKMGIIKGLGWDDGMTGLGTQLVMFTHWEPAPICQDDLSKSSLLKIDPKGSLWCMKCQMLYRLSLMRFLAYWSHLGFVEIV